MLLVGVDWYNPNKVSEGGLCSKAIIQGSNKPTNQTLYQSRPDAEIRIATPNQDFRYAVDVISNVRVPRVFVGVVPDAMIPGEKAGPYVKEYTVQNNGVTEMMMTVLVRESENEGFAEFGVPVYGVDKNGNTVSTASDYFNAAFEGTQSNCDDCVMVNGRSMVTVKVPLGSVTNQQIPFNLDRVVLSRDGSCTAAPTNSLRAYLSGCVVVTASHEQPGNAPAMEPYEYTLPAAALQNSGAITVGGSQTDRDLFWKNFGDTSLEVAQFSLNFVPFLSDGIDLLGQVYNTAVGEEVDPVLATLASAGLILDTTTGGVGDITAPVKAVYKFSLRTAEGGLAVVIKDTVSAAITSGKNALGIIDELRSGFEFVVSIAKGGFGTIKNFDHVFDDVAEVACSITSGPARIGAALEIAATSQCKKQFAETLTNAKNRMDEAGLAFDTRKYIDGVAQLKDRGVGGYDDLLNEFARVGDKGNLKGVEFELDYALSQLNNQTVLVRWVQAATKNGNSYAKYTQAGYPSFGEPSNLDVDTFREVISPPGNYLDSKKWIIDQCKVKSGLLTDAEDQLSRMQAWVAIDPENRIGRFVIKDYNSLTDTLWDTFNRGGVVLVNINGNLLPRP